MVLSILQWNARSLCSNGQEFKKYIEELSEKPNVICLQETCVTNFRNIKVNYSIISS